MKVLIRVIILTISLGAGSQSMAFDVSGVVVFSPVGAYARSGTIAVRGFSEDIGRFDVFVALKEEGVVVDTESKTCTGLDPSHSTCIDYAIQIGPSTGCEYCGFGDAKGFTAGGLYVGIGAWEGKCKTYYPFGINPN